MALTSGDVGTFNGCDGNNLRRFGYIVAGLGTVLTLILVTLSWYFAGFLVASVLCGMAESRGRCGVSHIGMIAPLKLLDSRTWLQCSLAWVRPGKTGRSLR